MNKIASILQFTSLKGDINQDGIVSVNDVNYGMREIVGKVKSEGQIGDVNVKVNDKSMIMSLIVGKISNV